MKNPRIYRGWGWDFVPSFRGGITLLGVLLCPQFVYLNEESNDGADRTERHSQLLELFDVHGTSFQIGVQDICIVTLKVKIVKYHTVSKLG